MTKLFVTPSLFYFKRNCSGRRSFACNADTIYDNDIIGGADAATQITLGDSDSSDNSFEYNDQDWKPVGDKVRISLKD